MSGSLKQKVIAALNVAMAAVLIGFLWLNFGPAGSGGGGSSGIGGSTAVAQNGKALYQANCASCHGADLKGQPNWRSAKADGRLPAPPHDQSGHTWHHNDDLLFRITKFGSAAVLGGNYQSDMMGYKNILSDEQIKAVLSYIKSTWPRRIQKRQAGLSKK